MINYLYELAFLLYGGLLIHQKQYLVCLIMLVLSLILILKGFKYKSSIIMTIILLIFITQYHHYFKNKETRDKDLQISECDQTNTNINEGFASYYKKTTAEKKKDKMIRKSERNEKRRQKRLKKESSSFFTRYPKEYIKNKEKIDKPSKNWGDALNKWSLLKENFFIILNKE